VAAHAGLLRVSTRGDGEIVDLTEGVASVVQASQVQVGVAVVFGVGSTLAVTTMEYESGGVVDLQAAIERLLPRAAPGGGDYAHNVRNGDTNAHAHLRAALIGPSETVPIIDGRLGLGTWQQVVLLDFDDRPRQRTVSVTVLS
jgi:secondary thiamine-phosphate synthase enzyme